MSLNINFNALFGYNLSKNNQVNKRQQYNGYPNLALLNHDIVSFGRMKKNQFEDIDLVVINKFKAPVEKFNNNEDLQNWCLEKINDEYLNKSYIGRQEEITVKRNNILNEWFKYCIEDNGMFNNATALLIIDGITSQLKREDDNLPPILNKAVLNNTISQIEDKSKIMKNYQVDFNKLYRMNLLQHYFDLLDIEEQQGNNTGWVLIPSQKNDTSNFEENVNMLQSLSHHSWCTKASKPDTYLLDGDFHIYLENGKTKIGIKFKDDEIQEIQGAINNGKIPIKYLDIVKEHTQNYKMNEKTINEFNDAEEARNEINKFKNKLGKPIESATADELFIAANMYERRDENDGLIILKNYSQPSDFFSWEDIGVNDEKIFRDIKEIKENADFRGSKIKNLGKLKKIGGYTIIRGSKIENLGDLEEIGYSADFKYSKLTNLGKLKKIGGFADFSFSKINSLGTLETIEGDAYFEGSDITDLGILHSIEGNAYFRNSIVSNLGQLESVGGKVIIANSCINPMEVVEKRFRMF